MNRGTEAVIDLAALRHNLKIIKGLSKNRPIIAVVKADAYGHGAVEISKCLVSEGVGTLAVAFTGEAAALRNAGIDADILVLFDRFDPEDYFKYNLIPVIQDRDAAAIFSAHAVKRSVTLSVHIKVDTGMGRGGLNSEDPVEGICEIASMKGIRVEGLMSHFAEADSPDKINALEQGERFRRIVEAACARLGRKIAAHMANSAALLSIRDSLFDAVRPGIMMYGCSPLAGDFGLKQVMSVKTRVLSVREMPEGTPVGYGRTFVTRRKSRLAALAVGYADGYSRLFSNNAEVLIRGKRAPVAGRICMDLTMADVTDIDGVVPGDEVFILGGLGENAIGAGECAARINTIPYEITVCFGGGAGKVYIN